MLSTLSFGVAIDRLASSSQRTRHLSPLSAGAVRASVSLWNPSDAADVRPTLSATTAGDDAGGDLLVSGTVAFVPDADLADLLLVSAVLAADAAPRCVVGLILDATAAGVSIEPLTTIDGGSYSRVILDQVRNGVAVRMAVLEALSRNLPNA